MQRAILRPPGIVFKGRYQSSDELAAIAEGWLDFVHASIPPTGGLTALALSNHSDAVALFFALSSVPLPLIVLPADPRAWRSSPRSHPAPRCSFRLRSARWRARETASAFASS